MYGYFYHICTKMKNNKYQVYKLILNDDKIISKDVLYFSINNLKLLMNKLSTDEYMTHEKNSINIEDIEKIENVEDKKERQNYIYKKLLEGNLTYP